ncbi:pentapeptide repeat-containing protein [Streptomyces sp. CC0208]|uniref:pentapeptide repeat-containing protein n=1 Tax=Streptomyces sp. CC0208 TaxID=2306165 RepID=UPI001968D17C|nr:pentapeptide repeat-containing protein [Streptomyces sp. CC0208]
MTTRGTPRPGARRAQLQRIAGRRRQLRGTRARAPLGARRPGQRAGAAERHRGLTGSAAGGGSRSDEAGGGAEGASWWARLERSVGLLATTASLAVAAFAWVSIRQVDSEQHITREGQIADRFNAAVEHIGDDSEDVRLGGVYALQRIMQDSPRDQPTVIDVLSAYIRAHAPKPTKEVPAPASPHRDVAAALSVLGARDGRHDGTAVVDLRGAYLRHVNLSHADLTGADLRHTDLRDTVLDGADLSEANLTEARLSDARLADMVMHRANLTGAELRDVDVIGSDWSGATLTLAHMRAAYLDGTDLSGAKLSFADLREAVMPVVDLQKAELGLTDLRDAILSGADLRNARMNKADLRRATLGAADFTGADVSEVDLRGADLVDASTEGRYKDLPDRSVNITVQQLLFARLDKDTRLPKRLAADPDLKKATAGP